MSKISMSDLQQKLRDIDVDDKELLQYFKTTGDPSLGLSRPFMPALELDPDKVELSEVGDPRVEAAVLGSLANSTARFRRKRRFRRGVEDHSERPLLVSEGDSWFQFPFLLDDTIDQLLPTYNIYSVGAAGDTLQNMIFDNPEYLDALDEVGDDARGFLFSGGGNDVIGQDTDGTRILERLVRDFMPGQSPAEHLDNEAVDHQFRFVDSCYRQLIGEIGSEFSSIPIFIHSYGHVFPGKYDIDGIVDKRDPFYAAKDQWIGQPLDNKGIRDKKLQREIVKLLLDRLAEMQLGLAAVHPNVHVIDVRTAVPDVNEWNDEIHPNDAGFAKVAAVFRRRISEVIG